MKYVPDWGHFNHKPGKINLILPSNWKLPPTSMLNYWLLRMLWCHVNATYWEKKKERKPKRLNVGTRVLKVRKTESYQKGYSLSISTYCEWLSGDLLCVLLKCSLTAWLLANVRQQSLHLNLESMSSSEISASGLGLTLRALGSSGSSTFVWCSTGILHMSLIWKPKWDSKWVMKVAGDLNWDAQSLQ